LKRLTTAFSTPARSAVAGKISIARINEIEKLGYRLIPDQEIDRLAHGNTVFNRLQADWALYPDHVVFLGPKAFCFDGEDEFVLTALHTDQLPELVFVRDLGVFENEKLSDAKKAQLKCYGDVMTRQSDDEVLDSLSDEHIAQLLDWEAEKYRKNFTLPNIAK